MNNLLKKLNINETYTKPIKNIVYDKVKQNTYPKANYNFMADLLHLPKTKEGFSYLFVIVDIWSNVFDMEPVKNKTPEDVLNALKKIMKRKYIKDIKASIRTDSGTEFKGVFHKWLYNQNILQRIAEPNRHQQMGNIEMLNGILGRLLNGYMNTKEEESGTDYREWTDVLDIIRTDLNEMRLRKDGNPAKDIMTPPTDAVPKFKVGDLVYYKSERPLNALGNFQNTNTFRMGDYRYNIKEPRKIKVVLYYPKNIRYLLNTKENVSYAESELLKAKEPDDEERYEVRKIIGRKKINNKIHYLVWWRGYLKKDADWILGSELRKDGLGDLLDEFDGEKA